MPQTIGTVASHYTPPLTITANKTALYVDDDITFTITSQPTTSLSDVYYGLIGYDVAKNRTMQLFDDGLLSDAITLDPSGVTTFTKRLDPRAGIFTHWIGWDVGMFVSRFNVSSYGETSSILTIYSKTPTLATIYPPSFESASFGTYTLDSPRQSNRTTNITIPSVSLNPLRDRLIKCNLSWGSGPNFTSGNASIITYDASFNILNTITLANGSNNYMRLPSNTATITYSVSLGSAFGGQHAEGTVTLYAETDASYNLRVANA